MDKTKSTTFFAVLMCLIVVLICLIFSACRQTESEIPSADIDEKPAASPMTTIDGYTEKAIEPTQYLLGIPGEYNFTFVVYQSQNDTVGLIVSCNIESPTRFPSAYTLEIDGVTYTASDPSLYFDEAGEVTQVYATFYGLTAKDLSSEVYINVTGIMEKYGETDDDPADKVVPGSLGVSISGGEYWRPEGADPVEGSVSFLSDELETLLNGYCRKYGYNISIILYQNTADATYQGEPLDPDISADDLMEKHAAVPKYSVCMIYLGERNDACVYIGDPDFPDIDVEAVEAAFCDKTIADPGNRVIAAIELFVNELEEAVGPSYLNISFDVEDFVQQDGTLSGKFVIDLSRATDALVKQIEDSGAPEEFFAPNIYRGSLGTWQLPVNNTEIIETNGQMSKIILEFSTDIYKDNISEGMTGVAFSLNHIENPGYFEWSND